MKGNQFTANNLEWIVYEYIGDGWYSCRPLQKNTCYFESFHRDFLTQAKNKNN